MTPIKPKTYTIDVLMPVWNQEELVKRAIESVPKDWNLIVCDDGSTDGTYALLKKLKGITLLRNKKNIGVGKTLNRLYGELKSDYHVILSSDDYFYPEIKDAAKAIDGTDLVYFDMVNNNGKRWDMANMDIVKYSQSTKFIRNEFFKGIVTNGANYKEDVSVMKQIVAKNPTVKYTSILGKHYNHPREGSLSWHGRRGQPQKIGTIDT